MIRCPSSIFKWFNSGRINTGQIVDFILVIDVYWPRNTAHSIWPVNLLDVNCSSFSLESHTSADMQPSDGGQCVYTNKSMNESGIIGKMYYQNNPNTDPPPVEPRF